MPSGADVPSPAPHPSHPPRTGSFPQAEDVGPPGEINPVSQAGVDRRDLSSRSVNVRGVWDRAVDAWVDDDVEELDAVWDEVLDLTGSDHDGYTYVSSIGWVA